MSCAEGCPQRLRELLTKWNWTAYGCGQYNFVKGETEIDHRMIEDEPTIGLRLAIQQELAYGRSRTDIARDVLPALMEGLDATFKAQGWLSTMKAVVEMVGKFVGERERVPAEQLIEQEPDLIGVEIFLIEPPGYDEENIPIEQLAEVIEEDRRW